VWWQLLRLDAVRVLYINMVGDTARRRHMEQDVCAPLGLRSDPCWRETLNVLSNRVGDLYKGSAHLKVQS
jgi:hypothetical protein